MFTFAKKDNLKLSLGANQKKENFSSTNKKKLITTEGLVIYIFFFSIIMSSRGRTSKKTSTAKGKKQSDALKVLAVSKKKTTKTAKAVKNRVKAANSKLRPVEKGYFRCDQPLSTGGQERYRVLIDTRLQRSLSSYPEGEPRPSVNDLKQRAKDAVVQEALRHSRAPFGRYAGVAYCYDQKTGVVQYAKAVYTPQEPGDRIKPSDLKALVDARFNDGKRRLIFTPKTPPKTLEELQHKIQRQTFVQGSSADGPKGIAYAKEKARQERARNGKRRREQADQDPEVEKKRKERSQKNEIEIAKKARVSQRAIEIVEKAIEEGKNKKN